MNKTNAMRILDKAGISYKTITYTPDDNDLSGVHIAEQTGLNPDIMFKTLVARGDNNSFAVFCIPVAAELDLKKCAAVSGNKRIELLAVKELLSITGYIRGGCSPIGMKKQFKTTINETAAAFETIIFSAGRIGYQVEVSLENLAKVIRYELKDICKIRSGKRLPKGTDFSPWRWKQVPLLLCCLL